MVTFFARPTLEPHMSRLKLATTLVVLALAFGPALADVVGKDRMTGCGFREPPEWQPYTANWTGPCVGGVADGLGVLRVYDHSQAVAAFYGRMHEGKMVMGVIESANGYLAGRFNDSTLAKSDDRDIFIAAFRDASAAADAASEVFKSQGNAASARYYRDKAKQLEAQMD
jgi:hypothetical protein